MPEKSPFVAGLSASQDFFELLRRIDRAVPTRSRLGTTGDGSHRYLRIVQLADMSFAPREVVDVRQTPAPLTLCCRHFGLFAPYGPLPIHMTEHARHELLARRNPAFQDLAALLSQRMAILHYRAWAQLHVSVGHDRSQHNPFLSHLRQLAGLPPGITHNKHIQRVRQAFPGAFLPGRGSLRHLQALLTHYFALPVSLIAGRGLWIDAACSQDSQRMGKLGVTRLGRRFFDVQHSLVVNIGPVSVRDYHCFQRGSERLQALVHICHDAVRYRKVLEIHLLIQTSPEMAAHLGQVRPGRNGWLKPRSALIDQRLYRTVT
ncbi:type VI secretion system baseplate subunit TssG [[Erwinia] mediterraneensis]|uniref:type VI secretion system baseplate subunit TssG n=1 Tax=[Erwinia] mediterraneensis TaxID=2161819 RepID=UPI00102F4616|nr:type VI secretion system baseplate subunit TssG [[Erwinia] mediterraneensis]